MFVNTMSLLLVLASCIALVNLFLKSFFYPGIPNPRFQKNVFKSFLFKFLMNLNVDFVHV